MYIKNNGYVAGAALLLPHIKKLREIVELEKFHCRILVDDERTQKFENNTENHKDSIHALRYNNKEVKKLTAKK